MIPKADILERAQLERLQPTTIEKDYVLGWVLYGIAQDELLSQWVFKGGTCLKKCCFETYRFSEDLDFTIPAEQRLDASAIRDGLERVSRWVEAEAGIEFPRERLVVEKNPKGESAYQARATYSGPLRMKRSSLQKIKFDLTQDELLADKPSLRTVHHPYRDAKVPPPQVQTYSIEELLAEKSRALYQRQGRARDVYDVVHLSRNFRDDIDAPHAARLAAAKFAFKGLPTPTVDVIFARIELEVLAANWEDQLAHQIPLLPPVSAFVDELKEALGWWLEPAAALPVPAPVAGGKGERLEPRALFSPFGVALRTDSPHLANIRFAGRNRTLLRITYHDGERLVEPYSLRTRTTGNLLFYAHQRTKNGQVEAGTRAFNVGEIQRTDVTDIPFSPRFKVEL